MPFPAPLLKQAQCLGQQSHLAPREASPHHDADDSPDERSGHEIRKPMDGHANPKADIESIADCQIAEPLLSGKKPKDSDSHREGDGRVGGWPAPKDPTAQKTEFENMRQVRADAMRRMGTTGKSFVSGSYYSTDYLRLADGPGTQPGLG